MSIGDWRGWRKLFAFLCMLLVAALKLTGPDLAQVLVWGLAAYMGGNVGAAFTKKPAQITVNSPDFDAELDMSELPRHPIGFNGEEDEDEE